ncbi:UDP-N-acetylglucosamine--N-acetylmuramyl-(pentapeptide) pyrophosphoryl-undecaprenol N-acetylglucosamine transferase [Endobacter medicaginis]|uniref:UDP-N-acetylglucosamine--N-acetylmuramyl-(pentapeptide) pyrophosphoryl-undecaprenol N-acetylglucosamine transferase n=3 Tax=Endobacter medicaginis TaxID=1181271 RepID=A0A839V332_9PROT|nr:undecaprenyldiphospho-muramoylpentapeptide beta-N-acetylglucosaminyltransferase [Endobacter medicaginis]MBB3173939.1 UDP-N-acetylglucosamine--N-acetylmuramyl-(pentapeptide) pyrophosphoryl-undecaprenol N-acetylglucosamine transferase [Endobacter medicaginis]MCX5476956.1 undecaprenyldiphospho-muramoylpentapeptide beta-N-acetylglucosaminyltransferase [Endobacter medicaginis]
MTAPIVIAAGGTGGHFFPAEALAAALMARGHRVVLMTDRRTGARTTGAFAGCEQHVLSGAGLAGRSLARAAKGAMQLLAGTREARRLMRRLRPAAVIGFGGYPCVPPMLAARMLGRARPLLVLHEQNAVLGRANRLLCRLADLLALGFDGTTRVPDGVQTRVVGNPVRPSVLAAGPWRDPAAAPDARLDLAVFGGSLGASILGEVVPRAVALLPPALRARLHVTQQCRATDLEEVRALYAAAGVEAHLAPFFDDMAAVFGPAALVISRAGASSIAELTALGRPSILVPLPHAIDDHQRANAHALSEAGGGWMMTQDIFTPAALAERLELLLSREPDLLAQASRRSARLGRAESADMFAQLIEHRLARRLDDGSDVPDDGRPAENMKNTSPDEAANRRIGRQPHPASVHSVFESR